MMGLRGISLSSLIAIIFLFLRIHHISAQTLTYLGYACNSDDSSAKFKSNLNTIISSFSTNINSYGFYNGTAGVGVDQVNAIALCRGDIDVGLCSKCIKQAANTLTTRDCPNQIEAITWYDDCLFRYSNNPILGILSLGPAYALENTNDASNITLFSQEVRSFAGSLVGPASKGYFRKYAPKSRSYPDIIIYGFMQCTPDISTSDCKSCLISIANALSECCYNRVGARWFTPSCSFRYEIYPFLNN